MKRSVIQENVRRILGYLPSRGLPPEDRTKFIAMLYAVQEEKRSVEAARPWRAPVAVMASVMVAVCVVGYNYLFSPLAPAVTNVSGTVKVYAAARNEWSFAAPGKTVTLAKNDILKTFGDGQADVILPRCYHMRLKNNTEIKLARAVSRAVPGDTRYELAKGKAFTFYDPARKMSRKLDIGTAEAVVSVIGTDFMVEVAPARTWVGVLDGLVKVSSAVSERERLAAPFVLVEPGQKTTVRAGSAPEKPARLVENELLEMEELYRIGVKPQVALLISTGRTRVRELLSLALLYISAENEGRLPADLVRIVRTFREAKKTGSKEMYLKNVSQLEEIVTSRPDPKYDAQFLLFIGSYYVYVDEYAKAIETFRKVIDTYPDSRLASIAQCAIGIVYEEKLADMEQARQAYRNVLSRYPASPEVEEAAEGLKRLEVSGGVPPPAVAGPARSLGKYRKEYLKGKYRSTISVKEGKVIVAPYDEARGPDYANGTMLSAGQQTEVVGEIS